MEVIKNIWILNHHATGSIRHHNFARELTRLGHNVTVFSSSFEHNSYKETRNYRPRKFYLEDYQNEFRCVFIKTPPYYSNGVKRFINQIIFARRAVKVGKKILKEKPDIIIGSSVHLFTGLAAYFIAKSKKVPFIFEVRDLWPQTLIDLGALKERSLVTRIFKGIERFLYLKSDKIVSLLPNAYEYIKLVGITKEKVVYIPNGVDIEWFDSNLDATLNESLIQFFEAKKDNTIVTYTGAFGVANGLDTVILGAQKLQDRENNSIHFLLVGEGPEKNRLIDLADTLNLNNITFHEGVPKNMIPRILNRSSVCLSIVKRSAVHRYGISMNKIFDYLASSKPMVSALESSFDFVEVAQCGLAVPPDSPEQIADALEQISSLPKSERDKLGKNGRTYVEENHDFPVLTRKLLNTIDEVISDYERKNSIGS